MKYMVSYFDHKWINKVFEAENKDEARKFLEVVRERVNKNCFLSYYNPYTYSPITNIPGGWWPVQDA